MEVQVLWNVVHDNRIHTCLVWTQERMLHCVFKVQCLVHVEDKCSSVLSVVCKRSVDRLHVHHWRIRVVERLHCTVSPLKSFKDAGMTTDTGDVRMTVQPQVASVDELVPRWRR